MPGKADDDVSRQGGARRCARAGAGRRARPNRCDRRRSRSSRGRGRWRPRASPRRRRAACRRCASIPATTACQSYVSSSRIPWATLCGASSHGHMKSGRWRAANASAASIVSPDADARGHAFVGSRERERAARLDGVEPRRVDVDAGGAGVGEAGDHRRGERAAADLDHDPIDPRRAVGPADRRRQLEPERLAAFDGEGVQVALAGERQRALGDRVEERQIGRVAGDAGLPLAHGELRSEGPQPRDDRGVGVGRDEHEQPAAGRARDDGGGEGGVPAAGDRERLVRARSRRPRARAASRTGGGPCATPTRCRSRP